MIRIMFPINFSNSWVLLFVGLWIAQIKAESSSAANNANDRPVVTPNFYDPNYHDDGRNHLRGPTAASSSSTISIMSPYAAASSVVSSDAYNKVSASSGGAGGSGSIMAIVDHFYGPNGEEQIKYSNPSQMDKEELDQILASLGSSSPTPSKFPYNSPTKHSYSNSPPSSSKLNPPSPPSKYGGGAPLSSLYKSSSSPSYTSTVPAPGYSLPSLYKSSSENSYSKPASTYRPAYSTIYKDPYASSKPQNHYSKGSSEYSPSSYSIPKDPSYSHSPKESSSYYKGSPSYYTNASPPKSISSISDALLSEGYSKGLPPKGISNIIDHDESYPYNTYSPNYGQSPSIMSHPPSHHEISHSPGGSSEYGYSAGKLYPPSMSEYSYGKAPLKAGFQSLPVKYSGPSHGPEYGYSPTHETYSSGFGGGYSVEQTSDPYSRPSIKGYMKQPPPPPSPTYATSNQLAGGHSLSSLYDPLSMPFEDMYTSPKPKPTYSSAPMTYARPSYGSSPPPPSTYGLSFGPPVEYSMPPKGYTTSSSPYGNPIGGGPKYKGPYRSVITGPSAYASSHYPGYGYGKPHHLLHDEQNASNNDGLSVAKDVYEYEEAPKHIAYSPPTSQQHGQLRPPPPPPSSLPPHILQEYKQQDLPPPPPPPSIESHDIYRSPHLSQEVNTYPHSNHGPPGPYQKPPVHPIYPHPYRSEFHPSSPHQEVSNEISHSPPKPNSSQSERSDEVHHVHVFENGFFGKDKKSRGKERHNLKWRPVLRKYRFRGGSGEGGHGSASMERDARFADDEVVHRGRRHRLPPPSRRRPEIKSTTRPYHAREESEEIEDSGRFRHPPPPPPRFSSHFHHGHSRGRN